jgi:hypothetical protein
MASLTDFSPDSTLKSCRQRRRAIWSTSVLVSTHCGVGRGLVGLFVGAESAGRRLIVIRSLLLQVDGLWLLVAQAYAQPLALCGDRKVLISEPAHQVEGLLGGLLLRTPKRVGLDALLDRRSHLRCCAEIPVGGDQPVQCLVRPLEVVALDEKPEAPLTVGEVREDRAAQKLLPQGLPEALDLAERLGVLRPTFDVPDAVLPQPLLEERLAAPGCVLPTLVGQHLLRRPVGSDAALQRFEHQRPLLVVRQHEAHQEARMVVHERRQVQPLMPPQEEGKYVRLPELVGLCALEAPGRPLATRHRTRRRRRHHARGHQHPLHPARRHSQRLEPLDEIPNAPCTVLGMLLLETRYRCHQRIQLVARLRPSPRSLRKQRLFTTQLIRHQPVAYRHLGNAECLRHQRERRVVLDQLAHHFAPYLKRVNA